MLLEVFENIINYIYPRRCPICRDIALPKSGYACPECMNSLPYITEPRCKKCSKPIDSEEKEFCYDCSTKDYHYEGGYSLWVYDSILRRSIGDFKFRNRREYAEFYVEQLWNNSRTTLKAWGADALIPIPIHRRKLMERGYNQAEILAKGLSTYLNLPVLSDYLIRDKHTAPQKDLNDKERLKNLQKAFSVKKQEFGKLSHLNNVILVDDIYTTGSTIEACTNILLKNGIKKVYFISLCIGRGY